MRYRIEEKQKLSLLYFEKLANLYLVNPLTLLFTLSFELVQIHMSKQVSNSKAVSPFWEIICFTNFQIPTQLICSMLFVKLFAFGKILLIHLLNYSFVVSYRSQFQPFYLPDLIGKVKKPTEDKLWFVVCFVVVIHTIFF